MVRKAGLVALGAMIVMGSLAGTAWARRTVPQGFVGVVADGPLLDPGVNAGAEFGRMVGSGVESVRAAIYWDDAQPYASTDAIPPADRSRFHDEDGVPTDFTTSDRIVRLAAVHGLSLLAVVGRAPVWARKHPERQWSPPKSADSYARFLATLIHRYGIAGSFWRENPGLPKVPLRDVQGWNEPLLRLYWDDGPGGKYVDFRRGYAQLVRAAHAALKAADPGARLVLAGIPENSWTTLDRLYRFDPGIRYSFEAVAVHPFTGKPEDLLRILSLVRATMRQHGDGSKPLLATEISWPATVRRGRSRGFEVTERDQANRVARVYDMLAVARRRLGLERAYWYTWASTDRGSFVFDYAGLRGLVGSTRLRSKHALAAYRATALRLEGCRSKRSVSRCG